MSTTLQPLTGDLYGFVDLLDEQEQQILAHLREFLHTRVAPIANEQWSRAEFPFQLVEGFRELDIARLMYDELTDRRASRLLTGFIALEICHTDPSINTFYGVHSGLAMGSVARGGSQEQRQRWLPAMARMELIGAFALTEPHGGSDVAGGLETTAGRDGDEWVLNGEKKWIGNATFADLTVVWARDTEDHHVKGFVVEKDTPGFLPTKIEDKVALRTMQNADITLTDCRVPDSNRLQHATSFRATSDVLRQTRGGVAWGSIGCMMAAYELALQYSKQREQFGRPIAKFQLVQDHLATMLGNVTSSLSMVVRLAQLQDQGTNQDEHSALAKSVVTTRMRETVALARGPRRQRDPARPRRRPVLRRRRGAVLLRGHPRDQPAHRGSGGDRHGRLRLTHPHIPNEEPLNPPRCCTVEMVRSSRSAGRRALPSAKPLGLARLPGPVACATGASRRPACCQQPRRR